MTVDDTAYAITYDGWSGVEDPLASGGGYRAASSAGQWLAYRTTPTDAITLVTYRGPDQGRAWILIDGIFQGVLDLYHPAPQYQFYRQYSGLSLNPHTIVVIASGQGNPASSGAEVRVDGFRVGGVTIEDDDPAVIYKSWLGLSFPWAYGGSLRATVTGDATVSFDFTGTQFTWITLRGPTAGLAEVYVDGALAATVDLSNPTWQVQYRQVIGGLPAGVHTVEIKAVGGLVAFDGFSVPQAQKTLRVSGNPKGLLVQN